MRKSLLLFCIILVCCKEKDQLTAMNNVKMPAFDELTYTTTGYDSLKILIVGNSITSHGVAHDIGWKYKSGMAATDSSKDYVHLLFNKIKSTYSNQNITLRFSNWSQFERSPEKFNGFKPAIDFKPNIIIFQLSDNINKESSTRFKDYSIKFLRNFETKYIVSPFFINSYNYTISKEIAKQSDSHFIDISSISNNNQNRASSDLNRNDISYWKVEGISEHPGNTGMANISEVIYKKIINQGR